MKPAHTFTRQFKGFRFMVVLLVLFSLPARAAGHASALGVLCYVDANAAGVNDGASWENAYTDLQSALGGSACTEIRVAAGIYKPGTGADRSATFLLKDGVSLYGGFAGTETALDQRDPSAHPTILSGDLNGDDVGFTNNAENAYHVVTGASGARLDGFSITAGNANGEGFQTYGGGIYNDASSPALTNLIIHGNHARICGGGMSNLANSDPTLTDVIFSGNATALDSFNGFGGGLYNEDSSPVMVNVSFSGNTTKGPKGRGGGMYNFAGSPTLTDVSFTGNSADNDGGGLYTLESDLALENVTFSANLASKSGGGMYVGSGSPGLTNVTFSGNSAGTYGGGLRNKSSSPQLTNVTFSGNTAGLWGGGIYNDASRALIRDTILWGNSAGEGGAQIAVGGTEGGSLIPTLSDSVVQGGCPAVGTCLNLITSDPRLGPLGDNGGQTLTMPLLAGSSALDAGNDLTCADHDQRGVPRPQGAHCDIGAFEYQLMEWVMVLPLVIR